MPQIKIVTGKGGVGKSTFAAALAYAHARKGQKTLLIELSNKSFFSRVYHKPIGFKALPLQNNLYISCWSGLECLKEYCDHLVKVPYISKLLFNPPAMKYFLQMAPGLKELAIMGKLTSASRRTGPAMPFDVLVLDAPATGHFLSLIQAPENMAQLIPQGPVGQQGRHIDKVLKTQAQYYILSLAHSLVAAESFQLSHHLARLGIQAQLLLNKCWPLVETANKTGAAANFLNFKLEQQKKWAQQFKQQKLAKENFWSLSLCLHSNFNKVVQQLSQHIYEKSLFK